MAFSKVIFNGQTLMDVTQDTVVKETLKQGATAHKADGTVINGAMDVLKDVNFIDYDGSIIATYTATEFASLTELPPNPSHEGLVSQGWNWTLADAKVEAALGTRLFIGQMYITSSGKTEIFVTFEDQNYLSPILALGVSGTVTVDWGDGSQTDVMTGSSYSTLSYATHTYSDIGDYIISIEVNSGSFSFYASGNDTNTLLVDNTSAEGRKSRIYSSCINEVHLGDMAYISGNRAFGGMSSLKAVTIPSNIRYVGASVFLSCYSLKCAIIPDGVTSFGNYAFNSCEMLKYVSLPKSVTSFGSYAFQGDHDLEKVDFLPSVITSFGAYAFGSCPTLRRIKLPASLTKISDHMFYYGWGLEYVDIPSTVTEIMGSAFSVCWSLCKMIIPVNVTRIYSSAFSECGAIKEYYLKPMIPPTLDDINAFNGMASDCVIYVPYSSDHSILTAYQTANNWSAVATHMQEEPQS